jgi:hypothetical protein
MSGSPNLKFGLRVLRWTLSLAGAACGSFFAISCVLALVQGSPIFSGENLFLASICDGIALFFMAVFLFGKETATLPIQNEPTFLAIVRRVLGELGYEVTHRTDSSLATRGAFRFLFFCRGIRIQCANRQAHITGPKIWIDILRRRMRVQNFLSTTEFHLQDSPQRNQGVLLKRLQIQMRVPFRDLEKITQNVLEPLAQEAQIICDINVLVQSDAGIRESMLEQQIRPWLIDNGLSAEIHKDLAKMCEPGSKVLPLKDVRRKLPISN